jgi:hypothetical protein
MGQKSRVERESLYRYRKVHVRVALAHLNASASRHHVTFTLLREHPANGVDLDS